MELMDFLSTAVAPASVLPNTKMAITNPISNYKVHMS
jgi:hypothetical protein